jgi:hypothetical protein
LFKFVFHFFPFHLWILTPTQVDLQRELDAAFNLTHHVDYINVSNPCLHDQEELDLLCNKDLESVRKEHIIPFHKTLGLKFLQHV